MNTKVLLAVPVYQLCHPETMAAIYELTIPPKVEARLAFSKGYTVVQARNSLVDASLRDNYDYTFFIDSDIIVPKDALKRLLDIDVPIATGWYIKKIPGKDISELYKKVEDGSFESLENVTSNGTIPIDCCGCGCTLIHNRVFKELGDKMWFEYVQTDLFSASEDLFFCRKAAEKGFKIVADTTLRCGHLGQVTF